MANNLDDENWQQRSIEIETSPQLSADENVIVLLLYNN